jgi:hypothetical protein
VSTVRSCVALLPGVAFVPRLDCILSQSMKCNARWACRFVWPVGFIISVMGIGSWFNQLSPPGKTRLVFAMTSVSTVAMFSIGWIVSSWPKDEDPSAFSRIVVVALVIIVATGVGLPYYVPSGVFAAQFGGEQAGVVSAYLDGTSALATGTFLKLLSSLVRVPRIRYVRVLAC